MIEAQEPERVRAGVIGAIAAGVLGLTAVLVVLAWLLVKPAPAAHHTLANPSPLEHSLFDQATGGDDVRAAGAQRLQRTEWIDRDARLVRIPIDRAIDAVVADPSLLGAR